MYYDIYILEGERNPEKLMEYASKMIPMFNGDKDVGDFTLENGSERLSISTAKEFIDSGCFYKKSSGGFRLYGSEKENPDGGWVYFNTDGSVVFGLTVRASSSKNMLAKLKEFTGSTHGYVAGDCPPPFTAKEFMELCAKSIK